MKPYYENNGIYIFNGDCREVMPGMRSDMVVTDPPYGVNYEGGGHFNSRNVYIKHNRDRLSGDDGDVYSWFVPLMFSVCRGPCYVFFAGTLARGIYNAIGDAGGMVHALIVWHKTNAAYSAINSQYKQRHEPILYCKGKNAKTKWTGRSTESTIWEMRRDPKCIFHPTQKPVEVMARAIGQSLASSTCIRAWLISAMMTRTPTWMDPRFGIATIARSGRS